MNMRNFLLTLLLIVFGFTSYSQNDVDFSVDMSDFASSFTTVYVSGSFNGWCGDCDALTDMGGGIWAGTLSLGDGDYEFKYTADNWAHQEIFTAGDPCTKMTGCNVNRIFTVAGAPVDLGTNCWETCFSCDVVPADGDVTFTVDVSGYGGFTTIYVSGTFNGWSGDSNPLMDMGNGIWGATIPLTAGPYEYKFTNDNWAGQEALTFGDPCTVECGGNINRTVFVDGNVAPPVVCWNKCDGNDCAVPVDSVDITFELNMENEMPDMGGVFVAGGGNFGVPGGPGSVLLTDDNMDGIYVGTTRQPKGFTSYYTFTNGPCGDFSCKENIAGQDCADPNNFNDRQVIDVQNDTIISTCFAQCTTDGTCGAPLLPADVTFQVDMSEYPDPFTAINIFGQMNGWNPTANVLTDMGNGIWATTITLDQGVWEYKYIVDGNIPGPEEDLFQPEDTICTITIGEFTNRILTVEGSDPVTLTPFCFGECFECDATGIEIVENKELFNIYPTLADEFTFVEFNSLKSDAILNVYNNVGQNVFERKITSGTNEFSISTKHLPNGIYIVSVLVEDQLQLQKVVVSH